MGFPRSLPQALAALVVLVCLNPTGCHRSSSQRSPAIVINEISANGSNVGLQIQAGPGEGDLLVGSDGKAADWIEIYNPLPTAVNLGLLTLTTDPKKPNNFRFPNLILEPGKCVVVICDKDPAAGPLHTDFRLKAAGLTVYLFGGDGAALVDHRTYKDMESDATAGRVPDGSGADGDYGMIYEPTPGAANKPIGKKPPRFSGAPEVDPVGQPGELPVKLKYTLVVDKGMSIGSAVARRAIATECSGPLPDDQLLPGEYPLERVGDPQPAPSETRKDVLGNPVVVERETMDFVAYIPAEPDGILVRIKTILESEFGRTEALDCYRFGAVKPTLVINEFLANNKSFLFDKVDEAGVETKDHTPDWIEIYNYGDLAVDVAEFYLIGDGAYYAVPPKDFLWRFKDVEIQSIGPRKHLLLLADGDNPYNHLGEHSFNTYYRSGTRDRIYRSTDFKVSAGHSGGAGDSFWLLDRDKLRIDSAQFNFSHYDLETHEIKADLAFGRFPDGASPDTPLVYQTDDTGQVTQIAGGELLDCPTPEAPNRRECSAMPRFLKDMAFVEPRCPGGGGQVTVTAFLGIDQKTAAADLPESHGFEVELVFKAGGPETTLRRGQGLDVLPLDPASPGIFGGYKPEGIAGMSLYSVQGKIPGQSAGTLVTFSLRAQDLLLPEELGDWVILSEETAPKVSLRFKAGYAAPPIVVNEIYPGSELNDATPLHMDYLELFNNSGDPQNLSGMYIDMEEQPAALGPQGPIRMYQIPPDTVLELEPWGFLAIYFPRKGQEKLVPPEALSVTGFALDSCMEVLYLLAPDEDGNCIVAEARWNLATTTDCTSPKRIAVGLRPDGSSSGGIEFKPANEVPPSPGASNCGGVLPSFSQKPIHYTQATPSMTCVAESDIVSIEATVLVDAYAGLIDPGIEPNTGIRKAELLIGKDGENVVDLSPVQENDPSACLLQTRLQGQIPGPHPEVTYYRIRVTDGAWNVVESEQCSFGVAGTKPPAAVNEVSLGTMDYTDGQGLPIPWIELYNGGPAALDFGGMYLTDDLAEPRKWMIPRIPAALVGPYGFLVVFADGDTAVPDDLHASLVLRTAGAGDLFLLDRLEGGTCRLNSFRYNFTGQGSGISIGRIPDGTGRPGLTPGPTPNGANAGVQFIRGDATDDGRIDVSDLAWIYQFVLNQTVPAPACLKVLDVNDDGKVDTDDGIYLGNFLFLDGPTIPPPYPVKGSDTTPDGLPCS